MKRRKRVRIQLVLLSVIPVLGFAALYALPLIMTFIHALMKDSLMTQFVGLDNFVHLWESRLFRLGLQNLVTGGSVMVLLSLLLAVVIAWWMLQCPRSAKPAIGILLIPLLLPSVSFSGMWSALFQTGTFMTGLKPWLALGSLYVWKYTGICAVILYMGLIGLPGEIMDAASLDGAGPRRCFLSIQLPMVAGQMALAGLLLLIYLFRIFKESYLLFGNYPPETVYLLQHYMNHQYMKINFQYVSAAAIVLMLLFALAYGCGLYALKKGDRHGWKKK